MGMTGRVIKAILAGGWSYFIYIWLVVYIFNYIGDPQQFAQSFGVNIDVGDTTLLKYYIIFFGWCVVGLSFATQMAQKKTWARQMWNFLRLFAGIVFWAMFIAAGLNNIVVGIALGQSNLTINVDITLLFYAMMGGKIFTLAIVVLDFFLSFVKEEDKKKGGKV